MKGVRDSTMLMRIWLNLECGILSVMTLGYYIGVLHESHGVCSHVWHWESLWPADEVIDACK